MTTVTSDGAGQRSSGTSRMAVPWAVRVSKTLWYGSNGAFIPDDGPGMLCCAQLASSTGIYGASCLNLIIFLRCVYPPARSCWNDSVVSSDGLGWTLGPEPNPHVVPGNNTARQGPLESSGSVLCAKVTWTPAAGITFRGPRQSRLLLATGVPVDAESGRCTSIGGTGNGHVWEGMISDRWCGGPVSILSLGYETLRSPLLLPLGLIMPTSKATLGHSGIAPT